MTSKTWALLSKSLCSKCSISVNYPPNSVTSNKQKKHLLSSQLEYWEVRWEVILINFAFTYASTLSLADLACSSLWEPGWL